MPKHIFPTNPAITAACEYFVAHPEEGVSSIARRFGVCKNSLSTRLRRNGTFLPLSERKRRRWQPMVEFALANPKAQVEDLAARFGVGVFAIRYALLEQVGTSKRENLQKKTPWSCRVCGEGDPEKFSKSSRYSSGLQDKCKACSRKAYMCGYGKHRKHRTECGCQ